MTAKYYRWSQEHATDVPGTPVTWYLDIALQGIDDWDLKRGQYIEKWDPETNAYYEDDVAVPTDFPITNGDIPVYSPRLVDLMRQQDLEDIQLLPLLISERQGTHRIFGYNIANYLKVIDCLERKRSLYQVWTEDNLLFWQKRPWMLGTFRDVQRAVLDERKIGSSPVFRLWGWESMVIVREDIKKAIQNAGMTGCRFTEIEMAE